MKMPWSVNKLQTKKKEFKYSLSKNVLLTVEVEKSFENQLFCVSKMALQSQNRCKKSSPKSNA